MTGITINTIARRVVLNSEATVLDMLRQIQFDQIEVSKHEHITLADLQSEDIPVSGLFRSLLNFRNLPGDQKSVEGHSTDNRLFHDPRSGSRDGYGFYYLFQVHILTRVYSSVDLPFVSSMFLVLYPCIHLYAGNHCDTPLNQRLLSRSTLLR